MSELYGVRQQLEQGVDSRAQMGVEKHIGPLLLNQFEHQMGRFFNPRRLNGLFCYDECRSLIIALQHSIALNVRQLQHLVYQTSNAVGVLHYLYRYVLLLIFGQSGIIRCQHLSETANHVERRAYLVGYLLDEVALHAGRLFGTGIGYLEGTILGLQLVVSLLQLIVGLLQALAVAIPVDAEHQQEHEAQTCQQSPHPHRNLDGSKALGHLLTVDLVDDTLFFHLLELLVNGIDKSLVMAGVAVLARLQ